MRRIMKKKMTHWEQKTLLMKTKKKLALENYKEKKVQQMKMY